MNVTTCSKFAGATAVLFALPALVSAAPMAFHAEVLSKNPYVYYRLGDDLGTTAADTSGNSRNGAYVNDPTLGVLGAGPASDDAATFNGLDQYVTSNTIAGFGSLMANSSFEFVFKTTTAAQTSLFGAFNTGSTTGIEINLNRNAPGSGGANMIRMFLRDENGANFGIAFTNADAFDGEYHHLLFTYDSSAGANSVQAYLDGQPQTINAPGGTPSNFANFGFDPAFAARNVRGPISQYFAGTLDEVALYATTLTAAEALAHARAALVPEPAAMALVGSGLIGLLIRRRS